MQATFTVYTTGLTGPKTVLDHLPQKELQQRSDKSPLHSGGKQPCDLFPKHKEAEAEDKLASTGEGTLELMQHNSISTHSHPANLVITRLLDRFCIKIYNLIVIFT